MNEALYYTRWESQCALQSLQKGFGFPLGIILNPMGDSMWPIVLVGDINHPIGIVPNHPFTDKVFKMAFGMASNLFQLNHNFLTRFAQTHRNLWLICNDCLLPSGYFSVLACFCKDEYLLKKIKARVIPKHTLKTSNLFQNIFWQCLFSW